MKVIWCISFLVVGIVLGEPLGIFETQARLQGHMISDVVVFCQKYPNIKHHMGDFWFICDKGKVLN